MLQRPSRGLWIAAIAVALVCVGSLAWGLVTHWDAEPDPTPPAASSRAPGGGFGLGLGVGIGAGIVIGSLLAARARR